MYADKVTDSMRRAIDETDRRRGIQMRYNQEHGIVPKTIKKNVHELIEISKDATKSQKGKDAQLSKKEKEELIAKLEKDMREASRMLEFEYAAILRDRIIELRG